MGWGAGGRRVRLAVAARFIHYSLTCTGFGLTAPLCYPRLLRGHVWGVDFLSARRPRPQIRKTYISLAHDTSITFISTSKGSYLQNFEVTLSKIHYTSGASLHDPSLCCEINIPSSNYKLSE